MKTDLKSLRDSSIYAEEALLVEVQSLLETVMHEKGISRSALAEAMGVSRARVTQMFSDDSRNFTIRLLARALFALGERVEVTCETHRKACARREVFETIATPMAEFDCVWSWSAVSAANDRGHDAVPARLDVANCVQPGRAEKLIASSLRRERARAAA